jgi:hydrogenase expression/formation protein HypD
MVHPLLKDVPKLGKKIKLMHVCGTHQDTLVKHGLQSLFDRSEERRVGKECDR